MMQGGVRAALLAGFALLAGCAGGPSVPVGATACPGILHAMDRRIRDAGVGDGGPRVVEGFGFLRLDRPLAAATPEPDSPAFSHWARRARALDRSARDYEMRNLGVPGATRREVEVCADSLLADALADGSARRRLAAAAKVAPEYVSAWRVMGLYPLASVAMLAGVQRLKSAIEDDFRTPLDSLPVHGRLVRFAPRSPQPVVPAAGEAFPLDPLGWPDPTPAMLESLFRRHAPVFEVDVVRADDRIGRLVLDAPGLARLVHTEPVVYRRHTVTRMADRWLLQLEYWAWFRSRPARGALDILAGHLDGLVWRVTVDRSGHAVAHDSIHPCGCYHLVFPGVTLARRPPPARYEEPVLEVPPPADGPGRVVLRVAAGSHYLQRAYRDSRDDGVAYRELPYDTLRSLPLPGGGRRSLFQPDGLVPGTERGERWLLWMSGIVSPGAMRQAGRHAIAFVGHRHFDDPDLLHRYYRMK